MDPALAGLPGRLRRVRQHRILRAAGAQNSPDPPFFLRSDLRCGSWLVRVPSGDGERDALRQLRGGRWRHLFQVFLLPS